MPDLSFLLGPLDWIVHPLAGVALAHFASVIFTRRGKQPAYVAHASGILALLAVLGATWVVHPAAGMLLGAFASRAFRRRRDDRPALVAVLLSAGLFMLMGAGWVIFPLAVMAMLALMGGMMAAGRRDAAERGEGTPVQALPRQAGGLPLGTFGAEPEPVPVAQRVAQASAAQPSSAQSSPVQSQTDPFTALQLDARLPGEVRAQLVALDLRTREALTHLKAQGQGGSEAEYLARTIREQYAPDSVGAYLKLPRTRADVTPIEGGKTGKDLLMEQLDLLLTAVQDILDRTLRSGGQELLTHQRFLEDKFRKVKPDLDV
ncbi:hypothetical protein CVO96_00435 [Deinococcus koreensis]|uniref:Uncharacterized protein n=1 Tax=Deinococcus koreensis TaxID=2054903 RepID=A0A2K3V1W0_9DEIO|nr:hypothetical protein CVO96_00435 [Deinococcus koreensis]